MAIAVAVALAACNSPQDKMNEAEAARIEADKKVAEVTAETNRKAAEVQRKAAEETARIAQRIIERFLDESPTPERCLDASTSSELGSRSSSSGHVAGN